MPKQSLCNLIEHVKAFVTVPHSIILKKLQSLGIGGSLLKLIASHKTECNKVKLKTVNQKSVSFTSGVHQGSRLSSFFFIAFIKTCSSDACVFNFCSLMTIYWQVHLSSLIELQKDLLSLMKWVNETNSNLTGRRNYYLFGKSKVQCDYLILYMKKMISIVRRRVFLILMFGFLQIQRRPIIYVLKYQTVKNA